MNLTLEQYEKLNPCCEIAHKGTRMIFFTPSLFTKWRVDTIYSKEPCTLEWIAGFNAGDILVDVGANVGMYSIWAAATRKAKVFAFEPESQNYSLLNRNIRLNNLQNEIKAYCAGLSDQVGLTELFMAELRAGGSNHSVGESLDYKHEPLKAKFTQWCISFRLDDLVLAKAVPIPNHIKIDVDGFEPKVIAGARGTLINSAVRSLLIETNPNLRDHREMIVELNGLGFRHDPSQAERAARKDGPFRGIAEHIFTR